MGDNEWVRLTPEGQVPRNVVTEYMHESGRRFSHLIADMQGAVRLSTAELAAIPPVKALIEAVKDVLEYADTSGGEFDYLEQAVAAFEEADNE